MRFWGEQAAQLEYTIPLSGRRRVDMFHAYSGAVFEVEPITLMFSSRHGVAQAIEYAEKLNYASDRLRLTGRFNGQEYDWNDTDFRLGSRFDWPGKFIIPIPNFPVVELVADFVRPGLIAYWIQPRVNFSVERAREESPNRRLVRERGYVPGGPLVPVPVPVPAQVSVPIPSYTSQPNPVRNTTSTIGTDVAVATGVAGLWYKILNVCNNIRISRAALYAYGVTGGAGADPLAK